MSLSLSRPALAVLVVATFAAVGCEDATRSHAKAPVPLEAPPMPTAAAQARLAPLPATIGQGDDVAAELAKLRAAAPEGEPVGVDEALAAELDRVHTDPGDLPRLQVAHDGAQLDLPLRHTHVELEVTGFVARATVTQTYGNPFSYPIEAIYVFPLPENSAVDDMRLEIGDRVIQAEIRRRADARAEYEQAKRDGHTAALLEQERPNVFTQSVANIAPGENIDVVVRYVQDLTYDAGEYEVVFPMVVGPRFIPGAPLAGKSGGGYAADTDEVPDASRITPPVLGAGQRSGHDISLELTLDSGLEVTDFAAPTHRVEVVEADGRLQVSLADGDRIPNRDFVFRYRVAGAALSAGLMAHRADRGGFFAMTIQPPELDVDELVGQREIVFVVDVSGSMFGVPLALCKAAMQGALSRLRPVDTFNILTFAGATSRAFERPVVANRTHIQQALGFIGRASAGGGTHLADAVAHALSPDVEAGRHRYVFFLTDGYVGNEAAIFRGAETLVREMEAKGQRGRVFGMGTGSSVNRHLLDGLAEAGKGTTVYVTHREEPAGAVDRFFGLIDHPVLTDLSLDWGDLPVEDLEPVSLPDLFASRPLVVHGRYSAGATGEVTLRGLVGDREVELQVPVTLPEREEAHGALETLWARTRIGELERDLWYGRDEQTEQAITDLGLDFRIVTAFTSFVAVDRSRVVEGEAKTVVQPVEAPEGVDAERAGAVLAQASAPMMKAPSAAPMGKRTYAFESATVEGALGGGGIGLSGVGRGGGGLGRVAAEEKVSMKARVIAKPAAASVSGHVPADVVKRVVRRHTSAIRGAYETGLKRDASLAGRLVLEWTLGPDGKVLEVKVITDELQDEQVVQAILRVIRRMRFPATGQAKTTIRYPFVFSK